jgi:hypothetical protein
LNTSLSAKSTNKKFKYQRVAAVVDAAVVDAAVVDAAVVVLLMLLK